MSINQVPLKLVNPISIASVLEDDYKLSLHRLEKHPFKVREKVDGIYHASPLHNQILDFVHNTNIADMIL